ncbi:MAG: hypothetical protein WBG46_15925 [Nonlabens sp.]
MAQELQHLEEALSRKCHNFIIYRNQINKDLSRSGLEEVDQDDPKAFLNAVAERLNELMEDSDSRLQQLYYLADVQERHLEKGIILGFLYREWIKVKFRLGHQ